MICSRSHQIVVVEYKILTRSISQGHVLTIASFIIHILTSKCIVFGRLSILPSKMSFWLIPSGSLETSTTSRSRCLLPSRLSGVWDHPVAQRYTLLTTTVTRCWAQSGLGVCCWERHCTKPKELLFQPLALDSEANPCSQVPEFKLVLFPRNWLFSSVLHSYTWIENAEWFRSCSQTEKARGRIFLPLLFDRNSLYAEKRQL